jgi:hypothetical protein
VFAEDGAEHEVVVVVGQAPGPAPHAGESG